MIRRIAVVAFLLGALPLCSARSAWTTPTPRNTNPITVTNPAQYCDGGVAKKPAFTVWTGQPVSFEYRVVVASEAPLNFTVVKYLEVGRPDVPSTHVIHSLNATLPISPAGTVARADFVFPESLARCNPCALQLEHYVRMEQRFLSCVDIAILSKAHDLRVVMSVRHEEGTRPVTAATVKSRLIAQFNTKGFNAGSVTVQSIQETSPTSYVVTMLFSDSVDGTSNGMTDALRGANLLNTIGLDVTSIKVEAAAVDGDGDDGTDSTGIIVGVVITLVVLAAGGVFVAYKKGKLPCGK